MCTVTIIADDDKKIITMNRDEAITRDIELPPRRYEGNVIYPKDMQGSGTWFAVSEEDGTIVCLMNRYDDPEFEPSKSRGEIPVKIISGEDIEEMDLKGYSPFTLLLIRDNIVKYDYDLNELSKEVIEFEQGEQFFTSSSFERDKTLEYRKERFQKWLKTKDFRTSIPKIHLDQPMGKEEYSCLMKRGNSITKSIIQAVIDRNKKKLELNYYYDPNNCFKRHSFHYELMS